MDANIGTTRCRLYPSRRVRASEEIRVTAIGNGLPANRLTPLLRAADFAAAESGFLLENAGAKRNTSRRSRAGTCFADGRRTTASMNARGEER